MSRSQSDSFTHPQDWLKYGYQRNNLSCCESISSYFNYKCECLHCINAESCPSLCGHSIISAAHIQLYMHTKAFTVISSWMKIKWDYKICSYHSLLMIKLWSKHFPLTSGCILNFSNHLFVLSNNLFLPRPHWGSQECSNIITPEWNQS